MMVVMMMMVVVMVVPAGPEYDTRHDPAHTVMVVMVVVMMVLRQLNITVSRCYWRRFIHCLQ